MSDAKNTIDQLIATKSFGKDAPQIKLMYAMIALSDHDTYMDFINGKTDTLKGFESPAQRTHFYFENKAALMEYAQVLSKRLAQTDIGMLAAMSYEQGKGDIPDRERVVEAVFIKDDRYEAYFPILTSSLVANVVGGIKAHVNGLLKR